MTGSGADTNLLDWRWLHGSACPSLGFVFGRTIALLTTYCARKLGDAPFSQFLQNRFFDEVH